MGEVKEENLKLAQSLLDLRQKLGLSQEDFASKIEISRQAVSRWEMGISVPSSKTLQKISTEFDMPIDAILSGGDCQPLARTPSTLVEKNLINSKLLKFGIGFIFIVTGFIGMIALPFLAQRKQIQEFELFKSFHTNSSDYITQYPLIILLVMSIGCLAAGIYFIIKGKRRSR